jgi:integrase
VSAQALAAPAAPPDVQEKVWNAPLPLLFQWTVAGHKRGVSQTIIRKGLNELLDASGLTDAAGQPLRLSPHDFRRIFATEAILSGMPPHIAQLILGH